MFIITKDKICNGEFNNYMEINTSKTGTERTALIAKITPRCIYKFRLLDDDGEVYCYGLSNDHGSEKAFNPLDWAMAEFGCTEIQYLENGIWETL